MLSIPAPELDSPPQSRRESSSGSLPVTAAESTQYFTANERSLSQSQQSQQPTQYDTATSARTRRRSSTSSESEVRPSTSRRTAPAAPSLSPQLNTAIGRLHSPEVYNNLLAEPRGQHLEEIRRLARAAGVRGVRDISRARYATLHKRLVEMRRQ
jgi:hypothetical protein